MKKKLYTIAAFSMALLSFTGCLDVDPESDLTSLNMWQSEGTFDAFVTGVHNTFRNDSYNMLLLGEVRSDIYSTEAQNPLGSIASKSERYATNTLDEINPGISNYAGFYGNINQINLFISKAQNTEVLAETKRKNYLGHMYGMRAFYYFQLLRSWENVVWNDQPSEGFTIGKLDRPVTEAAEIMKYIKADIESSLSSYGDNYDFSNGKYYWSKAATLMLKAEVFLWSSRQMGGGQGDATTALTVLNEIKTKVSGLELMENYKDVFAYEKKKNKEIIFAVPYSTNSGEDKMFNDNYRVNYCPDKGTLGNWYEANGEKINTNIDNFTGVGYFPISKALFEAYDSDDTRGAATVKSFYEKKKDSEVLTYRGVIPYKYQGMTKDGSNARTLCDDYPIYRYADLLLMTAEAKSLTGGDPTAEINEVRARAFGEAYDEDVHGYPHQAIDSDVNEAILQERLLEFAFEGRRWYDLRRFGNEYVFKYSTANSEYPKRLIWPIDIDTMVKNPAIKQTDGYESQLD